MLLRSKTTRSLRTLPTNLINSQFTSKRQIYYLASTTCSFKQPRTIFQCYKPIRLSILPYATTTVAQSLPNLQDSKQISHVTKPVSEDDGHSKEEDEVDMYKSIRSELLTIKETFSMKEVPRDSLYIGAAGILPYAASSLSTIYLAWDINYAEEYGYGYLLSPESAHQLLDYITPVQIGYGAIIISFLGAVHWGLEYAGFGGKHSYGRLKYGVIAPIIAWPTLLMPVETALISQFIAFNYMYFVDARATVKGWFPPWYSIYRFVLTFFVGASIVVSLISRGQIVRPEQHQLKSLKEQAIAEREAQFENLESEEIARREAREKEDEENEDQAEGEEEENDED